MMDRRTFIKRAGLAGCAAATVPWWLNNAMAAPKMANVPSRKGKTITGRKLNIAIVGCSGKGWSDMHGVASENIVAICDIDGKNAMKAGKAFKGAKLYKDFRKMFLQMDDQIDAVTVSTPDHMHFPIAYMAVQMGKHVFCQKPLTHTIWEARTLALAAREHNVMTQMGIQGHTNEGLRLLKEWLDADAIGNVNRVDIWTNRPIWPQGMDKLPPEQTPPSHVDWNLWLGTAPYRPYNSAYMPFRWRGWWDYGCGALGDIGCHAMDAPFFALELGSPISIEAECSGHSDVAAPQWAIVTYKFPARNGKPPVTLVWHDGNKKPERPKELEENRKLPDGDGGSLLRGDKGVIMISGIYCDSLRVIPETKMREFIKEKKPQKTLPRSPGHYNEWIQSIKGEGPKAGANFDYAGPLTEMVLLGNLAVRTGKKIKWDPKRLICTNVPEANQYVRHAYRQF